MDADPPAPEPPAPEPPARRDVLDFWAQAGARKWFAKDEAFDAAFRERFLSAHEAAAAGRLDGWTRGADGTDDPSGALALVILLDQFPRNAFRGSARMYATDALALAHAQRAVEAGLDEQVDPELRLFFYLPFEHSERLEDQERSVTLHERIGMAEYARHHRDIIRRFGRFPHRNALLGRESTAEELAFLDAGGFAG